MKNHTTSRDEKTVERTDGKKHYIAPCLTVHGDVRELTRALGGAGNDGQGGSQAGDLE